MSAAVQSTYNMLTANNQNIVDYFIELLFREQTGENRDTIEAIEEAESGNAPYKFSSLDELSEWIDAKC